MNILRAIGIVVVAFWVYVIGGGLVSVYQVRSGEARLQQAIEQMTLPGFQLVERPQRAPTRQIWSAWLMKHVPLINQLYTWGSGSDMSATYRIDETPTEVYRQYESRFHPTGAAAWENKYYIFEVEESGVIINVAIQAEDFELRNELSPVTYPLAAEQAAGPQQRSEVTIAPRMVEVEQPARTWGYPTP